MLYDVEDLTPGTIVNTIKINCLRKLSQIGKRRLYKNKQEQEQPPSGFPPSAIFTDII